MSDFYAPTWGVTVADVLYMTGATVEAVDIQMAAESIEPYVNRTPASSAGMLARDIRTIKKALVWQAAWLPEQPDYVGRMNVDSTNQDGQSAAFSPASSPYGREYSLTLAPMAARCLKNLSWKASRTLNVKRMGATTKSLEDQAYDFLTDEVPTGWDRL